MASVGTVPPVTTRPSALTQGPFLAADAIRSGLLTRAQLRSAAWRRLFRGVYVDARVALNHRVLVSGAALILPAGAVVTGRSAAHLYGADLAGPEELVEVAGPAPFGPVQGLRIRQRKFAAADTRTFAGIPVTTPLPTAYELGRSLPLEEAVVWLDALGQARALRRADVVAHCDTHRGQPGWRTARRAIQLSDPRAESPQESRLRLHLVLGGLPAPVPQYRVLHHGEFVARVDLAWPEFKIAVEYDGQWHSDPGQLARDRRRIRDLNALGWYVYPVTSADLHDPHTLVAHLRAILNRHGAR